MIYIENILSYMELNRTLSIFMIIFPTNLILGFQMPFYILHSLLILSPRKKVIGRWKDTVHLYKFIETYAHIWLPLGFLLTG